MQKTENPLLRKFELDYDIDIVLVAAARNHCLIITARSMGLTSQEAAARIGYIWRSHPAYYRMLQRKAAALEKEAQKNLDERNKQSCSEK